MNLDTILTTKTFLYGFLLWLIPFAVGFFTFPIKKKKPLMFKTLMSLVLVITTVALMRYYFVQITPMNAEQGLGIGLLWAAICLVIDLPIFTLGFKMPALSYLLEIGLAYLMVPVITWGSASLMSAIVLRAIV